jgi:signal transduction histidine kinase
MEERLKRVLIIDDIRTDLHFIGKLITSFGHEAVLSDSAVSALEILDRSFDLIIVDALMPEMTGFDFVNKIKCNLRVAHIPVIMVTSLSGRDDRLKAVKSGINDYIIKPVDKVELNVRVNSMLKMKSAQDKVRDYQTELEKLVAQKTMDLSKTLFKLQTVLDGINDAMIAINKNGDITEFNFAFQKLTGLPEKDLHINIEDLLTFDQFHSFKDLIHAETETEKDIEFEQWGNRIFSILVTPMEISNIFMMRDITEKTKVDSQRKRFLSLLSHELRTPLNGILGISEIILDEGGLDDDLRENIKDIFQSGRDLEKIVEELLKFVQINERDTEKEDDVNVEEIIHNVFKMYKDESEDKNITLSLSIDSGYSYPTVSAIPVHITEIVKQVIDNSIKFGKNNGITKVSLNLDGNNCMVKIIDNGYGIPKVKLPLIFDSFYQAQDYATRESRGLGLGLTISKRLIEIYNGTIEIVSKEKQGTEVVLLIPAKIH